ncbi:52 kDa repressor of the inhibitor of the protein kinase-like [Aphis gossypii]|uniref:52 kDa repressor of the inhibitor of the protein kinase-like n=1 Tax=Aphis gossypii TaxID=80765 RepID=UPI0021596106|nr:52 kDa repressor of the inhibitor of the protein kinase-like [Aphis gossypii]
MNEDKTNKRKNTILSFFVKKPKANKVNEDENKPNEPSANNESIELTSIEDSDGRGLPSQVPIHIEEPLNIQQYHKNDVGLLVQRNSISDEDKHLILTNVWVPPSNYKFPISEKNKKRGLRFQYKWLTEYNWLSYSELKDGAFCKYCVIFAKTGGTNSQPLGQLVIKALNEWKNAKEIIIFRTHSQRSYHQSAILDSENFLNIYSHKELSIIDRLDSERTKQIKSNRNRLVPIIDCVILCGRQELALRGHNDSGSIYDCDNINQGNFRAILKYRADGDDYLKSILQKEGRNKFICPQIQNEIISVCGDVILKKIVNQVNDSKCFTVLADETNDISVVEQLALCVRYVDKNKNLNDNFLKFIPVQSLTGKNLADSILNGLMSCGVDCNYLYGQGYDGASNMAGHMQGVQAHVRAMYPKALYIHCAAHSLNLAVSTASNIKPIRNCLGIIEKLYVFFNTPKRNNVLLSCIENSDTDIKVKTLKRLCVTRWVQRYDAVHDFVELFEFVLESLETISEWNDSSGSTTDANLLLKAIDSEFIVSVYVVKLLFSFGLPLCKQLQKERIDLKEAVDLTKDIVSELKSMRSECDNEFNKIFLQAKAMAVKIDIELTIKRLNKRQTNRANPLSDQKMDAETYYKITVFIPYVDYFITKLENRFLAHSDIFKGFESLFSSNTILTEVEETSFMKLVEFYQPDVENLDILLVELKLWRRKLSRSSNNVPKSAIQALIECDANIFPNIFIIIKILCTLPVSTTTPERMFSSLKRIKTYLRNTTTEVRLKIINFLFIVIK